MLKTMRLFNFFFVFVLASSLQLKAQDFAPASVAGKVFTLDVTTGSTPFVSAGEYRLFTLPAATNFSVLGFPGGGLNSGSYADIKSSTNSVTFALTDAQSATSFTLLLSFASPEGGTFSLSGGGGSQTGSFSIQSYFQVSQPDMMLSVLTNGHFESQLSGQIGLSYEIESSGNLKSWQPFNNVTLSDLTTNLDTAVGAASQFFRARVETAAFAPSSMVNKTLNETITASTGSAWGSGIRQWVAASSGATFQIVAGPSGADSSGSYVFSRTGPASAQMACVDSLSGNVSQALFFTSPETGYFYESNSTGTQSGSFSMADGAVEFLGNISIVTDPSRAASLTFPADGSTPSFSVTNAAGWIWTLSFPADALLTPRTITMTPFDVADDGNSLLPITNGVQLEPDGMQFCDVVTLTVTPPVALGPHATLVLANDDGSDFHLAPTTNSPGQYSTQLLHFTSAAASNPSDDDWNNFVENHLPSAQAAFQNAVSQAEALERVVVTPPEPPDYELKCDPSQNTNGDAEIDAYQKALFAKESAAMQNMLNAAHEIQLLTGDDSAANEAQEVARSLVESAAFRKVDSLFGTYSDNPKKMVAVMRVALGVLRQDALLGAGSDVRPDWMDDIRAWAGRVKDYYFDKLRNEHDYSMVPVLYQVVRQMALLNVPVDLQTFSTDLANAMTFQLTEDITMTVNGGDASFAAGGGITVTGATGASVFPLQGSDAIPYKPSNDGPSELVGGQSFVQNPKVDNFDACKQMTASIILDRLGADSETWEVQGYTYSIPGQLNPTATSFFEGDGYVAASGTYAGLLSFPVAIANRNAQAAHQTFVSTHDSGGDSFTVTLTLTLTHTPK